jgi:hypothetical protein
MYDESIKRTLTPIKCFDYYVNISFSMEVEAMGLGDKFEIVGEFDLELFFIQKTFERKLLR